MENNPFALFEKDWESLDEDQRRLMENTKLAFESPVIHAKLHEHDEECQPKEARCM